MRQRHCQNRQFDYACCEHEVKAVKNNFQSEAQSAVFRNVARVLLTQYGDKVEANVAEGQLSIDVGSATVDISISPWRDDAVIQCKATLLVGARFDKEMFEFLLGENASMDFGAFEIGPRASIIFRANLLGTTATERDIRAVVWTVMNVADQYDDRLQARWGGLRASDRKRFAQVQVEASTNDFDETIQFDS